MKRKMFTLVEILTVVAIMAVLAGITVGVVGLINNKNAEARTLATIKALELALAQYKTDFGTFYSVKLESDNTIKPQLLTISQDIPASLRGTLWKYLDQKLINSATTVQSDNRYFTDGWGRPLIYCVPGKFNKTGFDLGSVGPDGKIGNGSGAGALGKELTKDSFNQITSDTYKNSSFGTSDDIVNFLRN